VGRVERRAEAWVLTVNDIAAALPAILAALGRAGAALDSLSTHQATLEDVFVHLTGRALRDE
jgi:ABC-2 type transport system ATP-binding protein